MREDNLNSHKAMIIDSSLDSTLLEGRAGASMFDAHQIAIGSEDVVFRCLEPL